MKPRPRKRFGQHWLQSATVLDQIAQAAHLSAGDHVLEIGPGKGVLTERLLAQAGKVVSVEIDRDLCGYLRKHFQGHPRFELVEADFLHLPFVGMQADPVFSEINKVVANIPYNITGPILEKLLGPIDRPLEKSLEVIVLLVQNEVAQRIAAVPGSKAFGALSVRVQYLAHCEVLFPVPPSAFKPPPQVESAVIRLTPRPYPHPAPQPRWMRTLVKQGFSTRRKMLRNTLGAMFTKDQITAALVSMQISPEVRAEDLGLDQWIELSRRLPAPARAMEGGAES
ncbi:16S rRNA (adenine(1518)-N(6)/adenine(1519)-N(6))-dimethyltransferase RsmA [Lyngbya confervoides]|uniref:Ribosomal RNA small subunit methyltransferase A n=1 Tax=Lyngbya confervoides BDU141951 TaxID=1574623 RepID=A0ABD4T059_9CYAN|nr:16S rRNA (adenine(1518)-N(6)/adenine(1519)-N(6))-dimethyltransferase RsmA [Lyngbya confervoides]MCM1981952.1 16S rRNA (adenine(1518)-N(6)/adenine(1519)-N(6))-dimethyltransferase RsmA [Lyngbya confervoides BDU141951]